MTRQSLTVSRRGLEANRLGPQCADMVTVIEATSTEHDVASIETALGELEDRQGCLVNNWTSQVTPLPDWVLDEERALAEESSRLHAQLEQARLAVRLSDGVIMVAPRLISDPVSTFRQLGSAEQEFLVRALFRRIELEGTGHGNGRKVQVARWELNGSQSGSGCGDLD